MQKKMLPRVVWVAGALGLAACQFQAVTEVKPDGSGTLRTAVGFTAQERESLENRSGSSSQDFCNSQGQTRPGVTVTEERRGDETWCLTVTQFDDLDELRQLYEEQNGLTVNRLEIDEGNFYYDVELDTSSQDSGFSAFSAITWTVTLPGTPVTHNAAQAEGNTLTWSLAPHSGPVSLHAESQVDRSGVAWPWLIGGAALLGGCAVVLAGGLAGFYLLRRPHQPPGSTPTT